MSVASPIVVFEKRPRWAPELRRQFLREDVPVVACRSIGDAEAACPGGSVLVVDLAAAPGQTLEFLGRRVGRSPRLCVIAVASGSMFELEWPARELGAAAFVPDSLTGDELAALCRKAGFP